MYHSRKRSGLSLVELLVVISIIAVIVGLILVWAFYLFNR